MQQIKDALKMETAEREKKENVFVKILLELVSRN